MTEKSCWWKKKKRKKRRSFKLRQKESASELGPSHMSLPAFAKAVFTWPLGNREVWRHKADLEHFWI